jgi:hypothetical protein
MVISDAGWTTRRRVVPENAADQLLNSSNRVDVRFAWQGDEAAAEEFHCSPNARGIDSVHLAIRASKMD